MLKLSVAEEEKEHEEVKKILEEINEIQKKRDYLHRAAQIFAPALFSSLQKSGTFTSMRVSSVTDLNVLPLVLPFTPGSQYVIVRVTLTGSLTPTGFPS